MRFPSLVEVGLVARATLVRFPWVLLIAVVTTAAGVWLVDNGGEHERTVIRWFLVGTLGLPLLTAATIAGERFDEPRFAARLHHVLPVAGIGALALILFLWPRWSDPIAARRYVQLSLCFHLLAAFAPYVRVGEANGFWQFNRRLFLRFLQSALYAHVLFLGLVVALLALDQLFGLDVDTREYMRLEIVIAFVFLTWHFLAGVPRDLHALDRDTGYPRALKVFSQFILSPIVILYLLILTAYMGKVVVTQQWPSGWIGYLVSSVATVGILSLLLVHPIQDRRENRWVKTYARGFYVTLFPSLVMLLLAVWKRIDQYGITENRYFLTVISLWLMGMSVYFVVSRTKSIKIIPVSLCLVSLLSTLGPWGAYDVSRRSQISRLGSRLEANGMLSGGAVHAAAGEVDVEDRRQISATLLYLVETHGERCITDAFSWPVVADTVGASEPRSYGLAARRARAFMRAVDLEYVERHAIEEPRFFYVETSRPLVSVPVAGFDHAVRIDAFPADVVIEGRTLHVALNGDESALVVSESERERLVLSLDPLLAFVDARRASGEPTPWRFDAPILLEGTSASMSARARVWNVNGERTDDEVEFRSVQVDLYLRLLE